MKFNVDIAKSMAKKYCVICRGRGFVVVEHSSGMPIEKIKRDDEGTVIKSGSPIFREINYCDCSRRKIERLRKR